MESNSINDVHYACLEDKEEMKKIYEEFTSEYAIQIGKRDKLIVAWEMNDITITPRFGKIESIYALKPVSELKIKFKQGMLEEGILMFQMNNEIDIVVRKSY